MKYFENIESHNDMKALTKYESAFHIYWLVFDMKSFGSAEVIIRD
jgi:hypothetical protein